MGLINNRIEYRVAVTMETHPEAISARDCAMAILCSAGRLRPARLARGGTGAAQAAEDTGPRTRAEGVGAQVAVVEMRALEDV